MLEDLSDNPTIDSLTRLIGEENLAKISAELAGKRIRIPHKPGPNSPLAVCVGLDAAQKISDVYGGLDFEVPVGPGVRSRILALYREGTAKARIAVILGCPRRRVFRTIAEEAAKNQMDLFS